MANELRVTLGASNSLGAKLAYAVNGAASPGTSDSVSKTQDATTSATAITITPVAAATAVVLILQNTDPTNYVDVAVDASVATPFARLMPAVSSSQPSLPCVIPFEPSVTYYFKAHTATCKVIVEAA